MGKRNIRWTWVPNSKKIIVLNSNTKVAFPRAMIEGYIALHRHEGSNLLHQWKIRMENRNILIDEINCHFGVLETH